MIVKITILRLLGSSDDKGKIGVARPEGPPLRGFRLGALAFACRHRLGGVVQDGDRKSLGVPWT